MLNREFSIDLFPHASVIEEEVVPCHEPSQNIFGNRHSDRETGISLYTESINFSLSLYFGISGGIYKEDNYIYPYLLYVRMFDGLWNDVPCPVSPFQPRFLFEYC